MLNFDAGPGQVIKRRKGLLLWHLGILTDKGTIIDATPENGVSERSFDDFAEGKEVFDGGYPGNMPAWQVIDNARLMCGEKYLLFGNNCEHLVSKAHGLKNSSPQLQQAFMAVGIIALIAFSITQTKKA